MSACSHVLRQCPVTPPSPRPVQGPRWTGVEGSSPPPALMTRAPLHPAENPRPAGVRQPPSVPAPSPEPHLQRVESGFAKPDRGQVEPRPGLQGRGETKELSFWIRATLAHHLGHYAWGSSCGVRALPRPHEGLSASVEGLNRGYPLSRHWAPPRVTLGRGKGCEWG